MSDGFSNAYQRRTLLRLDVHNCCTQQRFANLYLSFELIKLAVCSHVAMNFFDATKSFSVSSHSFRPLISAVNSDNVMNTVFLDKSSDMI